jgi:hypothetical protein
MRIVKAVCKKCGCDVELNIGELTIKEAKVAVTIGMYTCIPGRHVELGPMSDYLKFDWESLSTQEDDRPTDEEYGKDLVARHGVENVFSMCGDELTEKVGVKSLRTINDLHHLGQGEFANEAYFFSRHDAPAGARFYVRMKR